MSRILQLFFVSLALCYAAVTVPAVGPSRAANTIVLDEVGVKNLGIEVATVEPRVFEMTAFAIGRIEEIPASRSVLSSRISGRAVKVNAFVGDSVEEGMILVEVESRQPGDPPPVIPLRAAQSGLVIESHVQLGQPVEPATELLHISDRSVMWAIARIPAKDAAATEEGTPARIRVPAHGPEPILAELARFGIAADREAGTVDGIFEISNPDGSLVPGMRAEFSIVIGRREKVMAVPREALQGDPARRVVFVKDFDLENAFVRAPVVVGEQNDEYVEIVSGLFPGDEVVTRGSYSLGFVGEGTLSLKEALDAAHGHEHNEDGSELTPEQKAAGKAEGVGPEQGIEGGGGRSPFLIIYSVFATLVAIVFGQLYWNRREPVT